MADVGRKPTLRAPRLLSIAFDQEQWRAIEDYQSSQRISTVTETVRALIWRGLEAEGAAPPPGPAAAGKRKRSGS
jgi:hypothetical protein